MYLFDQILKVGFKWALIREGGGYELRHYNNFTGSDIRVDLELLFSGLGVGCILNKLWWA